MTNLNSSSCRICLDDGATLPIFEDIEKEDSIHSKICLCMNENIKNISDYPQNICYECNKTLDLVCNFLRKYKESCIILEKGVKVKTETLEDFMVDDYDDHNLAETEIDIKDIKQENDHISEPDAFLEKLIEPIQLNIKKVKVKMESKKKEKRKIKNTRPRSGTKTNKIASSILEGDFSWTGEKWCFKIGQTTIISKNKKRSVQQKIIKQEKPKEKPVPVTVKLCDLCGEVFKTADKLSIHKKNVHFRNPMKCPKCPRTLASEYYLNKHIKRKHEKKEFICTVCGHAFAFKAELTNHCKKVHDKTVKPPKVYACKLCDKTYKCNKSVLVHERSVHTGQRPAECTLCGSCFYHEDYLKEHMRLHTGETPFKCPVCGRGYAQRGNMKSHLRIHRISEIDAATLSKMKPNYIKLLKV